MRRLRVAFLAAALTLVALAAGPPVVSAITATLFVTSTLEDRVNVKNDGIKLKTKRATDVHVQEANFEPGDFVDWHDHPGFALIAVKTGTMTFIVTETIWRDEKTDEPVVTERFNLIHRS